VNINRGLLRFFVIGLLAIPVGVSLVYAYLILEYGLEAKERHQQEFIADLAEPACKEIIEKRGTAIELKDAGCSVSDYLWDRSLELSRDEEREINFTLFNEVLYDHHFFEPLFSWALVQIIALYLIVYVLVSVPLYLAYRIIRWGIAGFKSD